MVWSGVRTALILSAVCALCGASSRLVNLTGSSAHERGLSMGTQLAPQISKLYQHKLSIYSEIPGAVELWHNLSEALTPAVVQWAPVVNGETVGAGGAEGVSMAVLRLLAVEYELLMALGDEALADKCTGIASEGRSAGVVAGQNNDEDPAGWLGGALDVVLKMDGDTRSPAALMYTHPGWPAYMGINAAGLVVLWQYIDDGARNFESGLPTCVLIRELLAQVSVKKALGLLREVAVAVPNNFVLVDAERVVDVEVSPGQMTVVEVEGPGDLVHTNHVLFDQTMMDHDIGLNASKTTRIRFDAARAMVRAQRSRGVDVSSIQRMLQQAPVFRNGTHGTDHHTLASIVFKPADKSMHIRFKSDPYMQFREYTL